MEAPKRNATTDQLMEDRAEQLRSGHEVVIVRMTQEDARGAPSYEEYERGVREGLRSLGVPEEALGRLKFI